MFFFWGARGVTSHGIWLHQRLHMVQSERVPFAYPIVRCGWSGRSRAEWCGMRDKIFMRPKSLQNKFIAKQQKLHTKYMGKVFPRQCWARARAHTRAQSVHRLCEIKILWIAADKCGSRRRFIVIVSAYGTQRKHCVCVSVNECDDKKRAHTESTGGTNDDDGKIGVTYFVCVCTVISSNRLDFLFRKRRNNRWKLEINVIAHWHTFPRSKCELCDCESSHFGRCQITYKLTELPDSKRFMFEWENKCICVKMSEDRLRPARRTSKIQRDKSHFGISHASIFLNQTFVDARACLTKRHGDVYWCGHSRDNYYGNKIQFTLRNRRTENKKKTEQGRAPCA